MYTRCPNGEFRLCCLFLPLRPSLSLPSPPAHSLPPPPLLPPPPSFLSLSLSLSPFLLFSFDCFCLCLSVCEREPNGSVRLIACEVHIFIAARFASSSLWLRQ